jgi:hypothetical protein
LALSRNYTMQVCVAGVCVCVCVCVFVHTHFFVIHLRGAVGTV